jgi:lauroyl/myristoyl acyltransferase
MARALRSGAILGFVLDNTRKSRGIKLPGFWFKALRTPFVLARRYKTLILPVKIERRDSRFAVQIGKPSSVSELAATLKEWVLTSPEDWLWLGKA